MQPQRLFAVPGPPALVGGVAVPSSSAVGSACEQLVIARLLLAGHKVAVPVVDDDGVDLVVDYRTTVQVKSTARFDGVSWEFELRCSSKDGRAGSNEVRAARVLADVFVLTARTEDLWWVMPRSALGSNRRIKVRAGAPLDLQWRDAWHVFGMEAAGG